MKRNAINMLKKVSVLLVLLGLVSGCGGAMSKSIVAGRYEIHANGFGDTKDKFVDEANRVCPKGFVIIEQHECGSSCTKGTVKCE